MQLHREHVQCRLGCVVADELSGIISRGRVAVERQRAQRTGHVHDTCARGCPQQRQHGLRHGQCADEVGVQHPSHGIERRHARRPVGRFEDAGVVDQDVQPAVLGLDDASRGRDGFRVVDVEGQRAHGKALRVQALHGGLAAGSVARAQEHLHAGQGQLSRDFQSDALVGAGDQGNAIGGHEKVLSEGCGVDLIYERLLGSGIRFWPHVHDTRWTRAASRFRPGRR